MKNSQIISTLAVLVFVSSCGSSKTPLNGGANPVTGNTNPPTAQRPATYTETKQADITRECGASEATLLKGTDQLVTTANSAVDSVKGKKDDKAIASSVEAIKSCDRAVSQLDAGGACRVTKKNILGTTVSYYDQFRILEKCARTETYLTKNNARPAKSDEAVVSTQPTIEPTVPTAPTTPTAPTEPLTPGPSAGTHRQCTAEEFSNLSNMVKTLDVATKQVTRLGDSSNWKYEADTIANAALATKACENLIAHHDQSPCEKQVQQDDGSKILRQYTGTSLRQRCEKARSYFYEFVQNKTTLNFKNADLYVDISSLNNKVFEAEYINEIQGCRLENKSGQVIDYSGQSSVLVKSTRGFEAKMMVLETQEGLLIQCYGLNIGDAFSKREIVRVLKEEGTNLPLSYKLK